MDKKVKSSLKKYSSLASAALAVTAAEGQIKYTDINPDQTFTGGGQYDLDLNNDLTPDFRIYNGTFTQITTGASTLYQTQDTLLLSPLGTGRSFVSNGSSYAGAMSLGAAISSGANWTSNAQYMGIYFRFFIKAGSTTTGITTTYGSWENTTDKYLGLRMQTSGGNNVYGWVRLDANATLSSFTVKDYAFQCFPDIPINAGDTTNIPTGTASNVAAGDVADNGNGLDLQVGFTKAANETGITEYRIFVVKSAAAATFNLDSAKMVPAANYTTHTPNGNNFLNPLTAGSRDVDGNLIVNGAPYKVFVLSVPDGSNTTAATMVGPSNEVTLTTNSGIADLKSAGIEFVQYEDKVVLQAPQEWVGKQLSIVDLSGRIIHASPLSSGRHDVSYAGWTSGVYIVRLISEDARLEHKFFVR